jgi:hypothetical protein
MGGFPGEIKMRMWMVDPRIMCRKHLLGEHVECHMFLGTMKRHISLKGYVEKNCFEPKSLQERHDDLAKEMVERRKYKHNSPLLGVDAEFRQLPMEIADAKVDVVASGIDLIERCPECRRRYDVLYGDD